ncbi:MAG TPA: type IV pilus biogenesis/stability protein PilW [Tahibacter sp.]|uniref:type IV pilus biogenesis/stability protein PilW n=1 Tax=Tahibacter sp. TaxID=2056211 RepID=UPI002BC8CAC7|nr:type IV pilus biogenesis/stability protein PilW [Tahibacter sp.]HSX61711.1 type IV pilus biogenesis/stability protein PilW [Tahibacter sp.]
MRLKFALALLLILGLGACASAAPRSKASEKARSAAEVHVALGQRYMQQGKLELAFEKLEKALKFDASYVDAHTVIAVLYERINDQRKAAEHYRRAAELAPRNGAVNNNYGAFLCRAGKLDEAAQRFSAAVADPFYKTPDVAFTNSGTCFQQAEKFDRAEQDFRKAIELNPNNSEALFHLAGVLFRKSDFLRARAFLQRFESLGTSSADALLLGFNIENSLGNAREANEYARRLRNEFPDSPQRQKLESSTPS